MSTRKRVARQHSAVSLREAALVLGIPLPEYTEYETSSWGESSNWRLEPATDRQLETLASFGIDVRKDLCRGHASRLLDVLIRRARKGLASIDTVIWLRLRGAKDAEKLTTGQAQMLCETFAEEGVEADFSKYSLYPPPKKQRRPRRRVIIWEFDETGDEPKWRGFVDEEERYCVCGGTWSCDDDQNTCEQAATDEAGKATCLAHLNSEVMGELEARLEAR